MEKNKKKILPNKFLCRIIFGIYALYAKLFYRIKVDNKVLKKYKKIPHLVLSNHGGINDILYLNKGALPNIYTMVSTLNMKRNKMLRFMDKACNNIVWRRQFSVDIKCLRQLGEIAKNGGNIALFPEGRTSIAGRETKIQPSIVKLLKFLKLPVIGAIMEGNYMTNPRWANAQRNGKVTVKFFELFTAEELEREKSEDLYEKINQTFKYDEYKTALDKKRQYKGVLLAEGLENVLFRCPVCNKEYTTKTNDNRIYCTECGYEGVIDNYGRITPFPEKINSISDWYEYEEDYYKEVTDKNEDYEFSLEGDLEISEAEKFEFENKGKVTLTVNKDKIICKNENVIFEQSIKENPAILFKDNKFIAFYDEKNMYKIFPDNKQTIIKFDLLCQIFNNKKVES